MNCPVSPSELKSLLPNPTGNKCDSFLKALIAFPTNVWKIFNWMFTSAGEASSDMITQIYPTGSYLFAGAEIASEHWLLCNGAEKSKASYPALSAKLGSIYGAATDPVNNFKLPDFRGRFPVSTGTSPDDNVGSYNVGDTGGEKEHTLLTAEIPSHTHTGYAVAGSGLQGGTDYAPTGATGATGGGGAHENRPPYMACFVYIKT